MAASCVITGRRAEVRGVEALPSANAATATAVPQARPRSWLYSFGEPRRGKKFVNDLNALQRRQQGQPEPCPSSLQLSHLKPEELFDGAAAQALAEAARRREEELIKKVATGTSGVEADDSRALRTALPVVSDLEGRRLDEAIVEEETKARKQLS